MSAVPRHLGDYDLGPLIGSGGMSEVYAARHRSRGDEVAIKLLRSHLASEAGAVRAFAGEAERTRAIVHPNVVEVRDFGHDGDAFYLVMERLDGETLAARLRRGPLGEAVARELGAAIADGVAAAHDRDIVHRDLKPENIVLVGDAPKIVDFGIARYIGGDAPGSTTTRIGTPAYMAPEQLAGGVIAPCVDVWALGVVLFEMVAGRVPFDTTGGKSPQLVERAPRVPPPASDAYAAIVSACLEREPARRPATMREIARALRDPGQDRFTEDIGRLPAPVPAPAPAPPRRRRVVIAAGLAAGALGAVAIAWQAHARGATARTPDAPRPTAVVSTAPPDLPPVPAPPPPAAPAPAAIEVRSSPAAADIAIGGKHVGTTPAKLAIALPATIVVTRRGYRRAEIRAEHAGTFDVELAPLVPAGHRAHAAVRRAGETLD